MLSGTPTLNSSLSDFGRSIAPLFPNAVRHPGRNGSETRIAAMMPDTESYPPAPIARAIDYGAWEPSKIVYPEADIPVSRCRCGFKRPGQVDRDRGAKLRPLRDEGDDSWVPSFFTTTPFLKEFASRPTHRGGRADFDAWAGAAMARGDVDELASYASKAAGHVLRPSHGGALHAVVQSRLAQPQLPMTRRSRMIDGSGWAYKPSVHCKSPL